MRAGKHNYCTVANVLELARSCSSTDCCVNKLPTGLMGPGAGGLESFLESISAAIRKVGIVTAFFTVVDSHVTTNFPLPV